MKQPTSNIRRTALVLQLLFFLVLGILFIIGLNSCGAAGGYSEKASGYAGDDYYYMEEEAMPSPSVASADYGYADSAPRSYPGESQSYDMRASTTESTMPPPPPPEPEAHRPETEPAGTSTSPEPSKRLVIYSANVRMQVLSIDEAREEITTYVEEIEGFIESSTNTSITIRVPATLFYDVLDQLKTYGTILQKNIFSQDVTEQYMDLALRLENAKQVKQRLEMLLEKAQTVEEALQIQKELARLTNTIQEIEDQLKYLSDLISYSTVVIAFEQTMMMSSNTQTPFGWIGSIGIGSILDAY
jgi:hypothetical protein